MGWPQFSLNDVSLTFRWCDLYIYKINSLQTLHVRTDSSTASTLRRPFSGLPVQFQSTRWATAPTPTPTIPNSCTVTCFDEVLQQQCSDSKEGGGRGGPLMGSFREPPNQQRVRRLKQSSKGDLYQFSLGVPVQSYEKSLNELTYSLFVIFLRDFWELCVLMEGISGQVHD